MSKPSSRERVHRRPGRAFFSMSPVKQNIAANALGRGWTLLMSFAFVPLYIKFLGIEAFGIIGFFVTLTALFSILDMGISATLNRELARCSSHPDQAQRMRDLVRTLEAIYWGLAILIGIVVIVLAPLIARHWLNAQQLSVNTIEQAAMLFGLVIAFQWPTSFYAGGLMGLQRQVLSNVITSGVATVRGVGAVLILWLVSPTIEAYFQWQIIVSILGVTLAGLMLWRQLPKGERAARFSMPVLRSIWRFAAGMTGISIVTLFLVQTDKILLSTLLPLDMFGYYTLANTAAVASVFLVSAVFMAMFPRFSQLVALGDQDGLKNLYHQASQLISVAVIPVVLMVAFFSFDLLHLWTGDRVIAESTSMLLSLLVIGYGLNGLMHMPYALQLANGWTGLTIKINTAAVLVLVPALLWVVPKFGAVGAAWVWVLLNTGYLMIGIGLMHRRLLPDEKWRWYKEDVAAPLSAALLAASLCWWAMPDDLGRLGSFGWIVISSSLVLAATALAATMVRRQVIAFLMRFPNLRRREPAE